MSSKTPIRYEYGHNLMLLRESRGMTLEECCFTFNIPKKYWDAREKHTSFPGPHNMIRIARFFRYHDIFRMMTVELNMKEIKAVTSQQSPKNQ